MTSTNDDSRTCVDAVQGLFVSQEQRSRFQNEFTSFRTLSIGLEFLAKQTSNCEAILAERLPDKNEVETRFWGRAPVLEGLPVELLAASFSWYSVSACDLARLVAAIAFHAGLLNQSEALEYSNSVIPAEVRNYRDKIGAHTAFATRNSKDNTADRQLSVMSQLEVSDGLLVAGGMELFLSGSQGESQSRTIGPWSITKLHNDLRARYWPNSVASVEKIAEAKSKATDFDKPSE